MGENEGSVFDKLNPFFRNHRWPDGCDGEKCIHQESIERAEGAFNQFMEMQAEYEKSITENADKTDADNLLDSYMCTSGMIETFDMLSRVGYLDDLCPFRKRMIDKMIDAERRCASMLEEEVARRIRLYGDIEIPGNSIMDKLNQLLREANDGGIDLHMKRFESIDKMQDFLKRLIENKGQDTDKQ